MKFYGQFNPPVDKVIFERYAELLGEQPGYFIESGAFDGITESNCYFFEEALGWKGGNVEPFPHHFKKLVRNRPHAVNMNCALSADNGVHRFTHVAHPTHGDDFGNGSLSHKSDHKRLLHKNGCTFHHLDVTTMTYDTLVESAGLPRVDLLSLDVEGHEGEVLKGMRKKRYRPRLLCIETGHDEDGELHAQLDAMGYRKDSEYLVNSFYLRAA